MRNMKSWAVSFVFVLSSCSHQPLTGDLVNRNDAGIKLDAQFDFSDLRALELQIQNFGSLAHSSNQDKLVRMLVAFRKIKENLSANQIQIPPRSKIKIQLMSFCASPQKAVPSTNEVFRWVAGSTGVPLERPVVQYFNRAGLEKHQLVQELLWNLANRTFYEDYPKNLQKVLSEVSPSASIMLPSKLKSEVANKIIPEEIRESADLLEGKYYSYADFSNEIASKKSKVQRLPEDMVSKIPKSNLMASTESYGYSSQTISFYNSTDRAESIGLENLYLQPVREDVQPIILASVVPNLDEVQKLLEKAALKMLGYWGSKYPTLTEEEKKLVKQKPIQAAIAYYYSIVAENKSESIFPGTSLNGEADAFRHYVWSGMLVRELGESEARKFLMAHEANPLQPFSEKEMDIFNNEKGILAAKDFLKNGSFESEKLFERAKKEISESLLKILNPRKPQ